MQLSLGKREGERDEGKLLKTRMNDWCFWKLASISQKKIQSLDLSWHKGPRLFWIDHYNKKLLSWLHNEAFGKLLFSRRLRGGDTGRGSKPVSQRFTDSWLQRRKNSHTVTAARGAKSWGITSVCLCALISNSGELHLKTVDDVKKGATYGKMASLQPIK